MVRPQENVKNEVQYLTRFFCGFFIACDLLEMAHRHLSQTLNRDELRGRFRHQRQLVVSKKFISQSGPRWAFSSPEKILPCCRKFLQILCERTYR